MLFNNRQHSLKDAVASPIVVSLAALRRSRKNGEGMDSLKKIAAAQTDPANDRPKHPTSITKTEIFPVTAQNDPYTGIISGGK